MSNIELEQAILQHVGQPGYKPSKPRVIAKDLGLDEDQTYQLRRTVKRLVKSGRLTFGPSHLVLPTSAANSGNSTGGSSAGNADEITGVFRRTQGGFGFVRPSGSAPGADRTLDVYISQRRAGDASSGDLVRVRLSRQRSTSRPNPEGEIVEVIERETHQFVGTYFEKDGLGYVQVDGTLFSQPILLGDPGAKNAQPNDKVVFEMVRFPSHVHDGEGVITEVLGPRGTPGIDTLSIIREFNLPEEFAADALQDARDEAAKFDEAITDPHRLDLTGETIITIDPVDARDFDDAISLERIDNGHWRLGVHIADVSHFVQPKTPLDREAHERPPAFTCPTALSRCCRRSSRTAWPACSQTACATPRRCSSSSPPKACAWPSIRIRHRSKAAAASPMKRSTNIWLIASVMARQARARSTQPAGADARAGDDRCARGGCGAGRSS